MGPILGFAVRWFVGAIIVSIGWELGKRVVEAVDEDEWIAESIKEKKKEIKQTWTGRYKEEPVVDDIPF